MKKSIYSIILSITLLLGSCMNVFASSEEDKVQNETPTTIITLTNLETGEVYSIEQENIDIVTTLNEDGSVCEQLVADVAVPVEQEDGIAPYASVTDGGVTTRINFTINYIQSGNLYRITGVTGSFERLDTAFTISNRFVRYANYHDNESGYIKDYTPTGNSFSYPGFSNWVDTTRIQYIVGGYAKCNISRGGSSWELCCRHIIVERDYNVL